MQITIHTPTNSLQESLDFYRKLNFRQISDHPVLLTDGIALIEVNPDRFARAGVKLRKQTWKDEVALLEMLTVCTKTSDGYLLGEQSGTRIYLAEEEPELNFIPEEKSFGSTGQFAGLSLETTDLKRSGAIYEALGFSPFGGSPEAGYVSLTLDGFAIHLMRPLSCPHLFFNPSMTYFNGANNLSVIEAIRKSGIPIAEEITHFNKSGIVDNIIIRDPGGYGFFLFSD